MVAVAACIKPSDDPFGKGEISHKLFSEIFIDKMYRQQGMKRSITINGIITIA
jgi:hypothetical protein